MNVSTPLLTGLPVLAKAPISSRNGISPRREILQGVVPPAPVFYAGSAGDSPFTVGEELVPGTALRRPLPAWYHPDVAEEEAIPFDYSIVHEDSDLIVVDKPHFLPSTSNGRIIVETVQTRLRRQYGEDEIVPLHRLDRLTSGVLICSRREETRGAYQRLFQDRLVVKSYLARVTGDIVEGLVEADLHKVRGERAVHVVADGEGVRTVTNFRAIAPGVVEAQPITGHTHQIRAVLNHLGTPIVGDDTYPEDRGLKLYDYRSPLHLVATSAQIVDPFTTQTRTFCSRRTLPPVRLDN